MKMSFRWYGSTDPVSLAQIRQIPGMKGIVTSLYDVPVGQAWDISDIMALKRTVMAAGLEITVIESVPVHEDIKRGLPTRDVYIAHYCTTLRNLAKAGIHTVCYNFMPMFDWLRTSLAYPLPDGSTTLAYDDLQVDTDALLTGKLRLPAWNLGTQTDELTRMLDEYRELGPDQLWQHLQYFLQGIVPVAQECGIKMAIHPDDPPWSVVGIPRIIVDHDSLLRVLSLVESASNGVCFCSGSLGANAANDLPRMLGDLGARGRVHFVHLRNVKRLGARSFYESGHLSADGSIDMYELMRLLHDMGYAGAIRPDHGRMVWQETGNPGYGLFDRAMGATYLQGLWEAIVKS